MQGICVTSLRVKGYPSIYNELWTGLFSHRLVEYCNSQKPRRLVVRQISRYCVWEWAWHWNCCSIFYAVLVPLVKGRSRATIHHRIQKGTKRFYSALAILSLSWQSNSRHDKFIRPTRNEKCRYGRQTKSTSVPVDTTCWRIELTNILNNLRECRCL